jgi:hypothetical protein
MVYFTERLGLISVLCLSSVICLAQGFQNLDFEQATISTPDYLGRIPFTNAFPHWQASGSWHQSVGDWWEYLQPGLAYYNGSDMDQMTVGVYDSLHPVAGNYTAYIEADFGSMTSGSIRLSQTALIPASARSILFATSQYNTSFLGHNAQLYFSVNGQQISYSSVQVQPDFTLWAADITAYAGLNSTISFTVSEAYAGSDHWIFGYGLDNISFSTTPVPEPTTAVLLAAGLVCLFALRRKR